MEKVKLLQLLIDILDLRDEKMKAIKSFHLLNLKYQ